MIRNVGYAIFLLLASCAGHSDDAADPNAASEEGIQGGVADSRDPAVGLVWFQGGGFCTGTLISPTIVLTAGHCVQDPIDGFYTGTGKAVANVGANPPPGMVKHAVSAMAAHPTYQAGTCPNVTLDIGLIQLAAPLTTIAPVAINSGAAPVAATSCTAIGYGTHNTGSKVTVEAKRQGTEKVTSSAATSIQVAFGTAVADHGDSGGPLVCGGVIAGTTSCHTDGDWPTHKVEHYARVDAAHTWIAQKLASW